MSLFVGTNWNTKGLDLAVAGLADAHRRGARQLVLWVAGSDDAKRLERAARRHGVQDRVRLLGMRSDLERHFPAADVFLLPTLYEHGSRASHEAAACGLPLVVTATHGPAELIGDDEGGIVIEGDPAPRRSMGATARERMLSTNGSSHERYLELYEQLAARNGP